MRPAVTLVLVLAAAVAVTPVAVLAEEDGHQYRWTFVFEERSVPMDAVEGHTEEGNATNVTVTVPEANVTWVHMVLSWRDAVGEPDELSLRAEAPGGSPHGPVSDNASEGRVELVAPVTDAPSGNVTVTAPTEAQAREELLRERPPRAAGAGPWEALVELHWAGDATVFGVERNDTGNDWRLEPVFGHYEAVLENRAPVAAEDAPSGPSPGGGGGLPSPGVLGGLALLGGAAVAGSAAAIWVARRW